MDSMAHISDRAKLHSMSSGCSRFLQTDIVRSASIGAAYQAILMAGPLGSVTVWCHCAWAGAKVE